MPRFLGFSIILLSATAGSAQAQALKAKVSIVPSSPAEIRVQAESAIPAQSWSFRNAFAGVLGLGDRVERFDAVSKPGVPILVRKIAAGEYRSDEESTRFSYSVGLPLPSRPGAVSHTSWLNGDCGFLMLGDLLPLSQGEQAVLVEFDLPPGWTVASAIIPNAKNQYLVADPDSAVFFVGRSVRKVSRTVDAMDIDLLVSGEWPFADAEVMKAAVKVLKEYRALTRFRLKGKSVVMLAPLSLSQSTQQWRAETRGSTVMILLDPRAQVKNWIAQLAIIFTHEVFHLWVPNSLVLEGDYDWFFEGFTLYVALLTALDLKLISFQGYLDTIARVYDSYLSYPDNLSLIEASEQRWTSSAPLVYDKGMLVAFMYDLMTRYESKGKSKLADCYRSLFNPQAAGRANANEVIIRILGTPVSGNGFPGNYIESRKEIKLESFLPAYGLRVDSTGPHTHLTVSNEMDKDQHALLRSLGYRH